MCRRCVARVLSTAAAVLPATPVFFGDGAAAVGRGGVTAHRDHITSR